MYELGQIINYHIIAFLLGFVLDLIIGDPEGFPHPVRLMGSTIAYFEKKWNHQEALESARRHRGKLLVLLMLFLTAAAVSVLFFVAYYLHPYAGIAVEVVMTSLMLATKDLRVESMRVYRSLKTGTIEEAREAVGRIVGRDTAVLDEVGVTKAAVETVAENTSDGVIAPMLYFAIGGPILGYLYKAVNTMDSMIGYKNDIYLQFGRAAAKLDDVVNFLPSRISALLMIAASALLRAVQELTCLGKERETVMWYHPVNAWHIYHRDRRKHASPNSAQTESACAGALGVQLNGDAYYFGKLVHKPAIGDSLRPITLEDIRRANRLMYMTAFLAEAMCVGMLVLMKGML